MFYVLIFALVLLAVLIYLIGQTIGQKQHEAHMRSHIQMTWFFMLENGLYRAVRVGIDTNKPIRKLETHDFHDVVETLVTPENAFRQPENLPTLVDLVHDDTSKNLLISDTPPPSKTTRRRVSSKAQ